MKAFSLNTLLPTKKSYSSNLKRTENIINKINFEDNLSQPFPSLLGTSDYISSLSIGSSSCWEREKVDSDVEFSIKIRRLFTDSKTASVGLDSTMTTPYMLNVMNVFRDCSWESQQGSLYSDDSTNGEIIVEMKEDDSFGKNSKENLVSDKILPVENNVNLMNSQVNQETNLSTKKEDNFEPMHDLSSIELKQLMSKKSKNEGLGNSDLIKILKGKNNKTTIMIKNIPNRYDALTLKKDIDHYMENTYDLLYLVMDFKNKCNVGYAFINFVNPLYIIKFFEFFNNKGWTRFNSTKICRLAWAKIQGRKSLLEHYEKGEVSSYKEDDKPIVVDDIKVHPYLVIPIVINE